MGGTGRIGRPKGRARRGARERRPGLGRAFHTLWAANSVSTLGDGVMETAAPLLVASVSDDPVLVGLAAFVGQLPWLLFSLVSGALVDRLDKRRLVVVVDVLRGGVTAALAVAVWTGHATIPVIYACAFLLGTGETLAQNAASSLVPAVVPSALLPQANARLHGSFFVLNKFAGRPLGASLFVLAAGLPFGLDAASFLASATVIAAMRGLRQQTDGPARATAAEAGGSGRSVRREIAEGLRWVWHEPVIRMLSLTLCLMNITLIAGFSILVLYARDRLGLGPVGYGLLTASSAVGGILGVVVAPGLQSRFASSLLLRIGLVIETLTHVGLALAGVPWAAGAVLAVFGVHSSVLGSVETTFRQRRVPEELRGRVQSVFLMFAVGGNVVGALIGGPLVSWRGVTAPFWCSAAAMAVVTVVAWRPFGRNLDRTPSRSVPVSVQP
ncbi:MFS transporter [Actinacidiphila acidipaludis]|uniref:MFS transporter n=1 Tax=Actinacidiphila acidipaludis TaxID=2873382 RepID=A0ABS7QG83_9ACTN|nr:MFS transporter [Streptomyces acidipaludis]MBY8880784.1 MFS transporter [Streptomyces acidipaludis]